MSGVYANDEGPTHYQADGMQAIDAIRAQMSHEAFCGFLRGNIVKYVWRYGNKGGIADLRKARVYLDWLIEEEDDV
jgi:hypothetical protein